VYLAHGGNDGEGGDEKTRNTLQYLDSLMTSLNTPKLRIKFNFNHRMLACKSVEFQLIFTEFLIKSVLHSFV